MKIVLLNVSLLWKCLSFINYWKLSDVKIIFFLIRFNETIFTFMFIKNKILVIRIIKYTINFVKELYLIKWTCSEEGPNIQVKIIEENY